jgi:hypothetical protein
MVPAYVMQYYRASWLQSYWRDKVCNDMECNMKAP